MRNKGVSRAPGGVALTLAVRKTVRGSWEKEMQLWFFMTIGFMRETDMSAVSEWRREFQEEIDMAITVKRLLWSEESFWNQNGTKVHHLCFYYLAEAPLYFDIPRSGEFISHKDNDDVVIGWLNTEKIEKITIYPSFLKTELRNLCSPIKHFVTYD